MSSDQFDFIVIGSGLAGLNSAINTGSKGTVLLITKKKLNNSNTAKAQGGVATVLAGTDDFKKHIQDTLVAGHFHNNKKAVKFIIENGPAVIKKLIKSGVNFSKDQEGEIELSLEGGHQHHRIIHSGDTTGKAIEDALINQVKKNKNIIIFENCFAKKLLIKNNECFGVQIIKNQKIKNYFAKKTILASGGLGQVYEKTTNPEVSTGDGIALAYVAKCKLKDLEFIQFHPTALNYRLSPLFLLSEALRGEGAKLVNSKGERFMLKIHKLAELAPRDIVSKEIYYQQKKGPIFLDLRHIEKNKLEKKYPFIVNTLKSLNLAPDKNLIPVIPAAHYSCGGVVTNIKGKTNVKNLYATGEVACTGLHGANRLASNSLLEAAVMSEQIADIKLNKTVAKTQKKVIPKFPVINYKKNPSTKKIRIKIQKTMSKYAGIVRTQAAMKKGLYDLNKLEKKLSKICKNNYSDEQSQETKNLLTTAILIIKSALKRKKSLGSHIVQ